MIKRVSFATCCYTLSADQHNPNLERALVFKVREESYLALMHQVQQRQVSSYLCKLEYCLTAKLVLACMFCATAPRFVFPCLQS